MKLIKFSFGLLALAVIALALVGFVASRKDPDGVVVAPDQKDFPHLSSLLVPPDLIYNQSKDRFVGKRVKMVAKSFGAAPGAIVCPHFDKVGALFHLYSQLWERRTIGDDEGTPDPGSVGCVLLKPGTAIEVYDPTGMPNIIAEVEGAKIQGVTMSQMIANGDN